MKINVGSTNQVKINAVKEMIEDYDFLSGAEVVGLEVDSGVYKQPKTIEETVQGAMNRAKNAFNGCDYSFGIESGLMKVANAETGYMNTCACVIFDGEKYCIGLSSCFEYPEEVINLVLNEGLEINEAVHRLEYTKNPKIGSSDGFVAMLTGGRLNRKDYTKQAIMMALINLNKISPRGK